MTVTIGRRELLAALGGVAAAWPRAARAASEGCGFFGKRDRARARGATVIGRRRCGRIAEGRKLQCST